MALMMSVVKPQLSGSSALVGSCCRRPGARPPPPSGTDEPCSKTRAAAAAGAGWSVGDYCSLAGVSMGRLRIRAGDGRQHSGLNVQRITFQTFTDSSSEAAPSSAAVDEHTREAHYASLVFEDEDKGICCYRTPSGEVTCEGYDEGPHFHPADRCDERTPIEKSWGCTLSLLKDRSVYKFVKEGHGESWCEGRDES